MKPNTKPFEDVEPCEYCNTSRKPSYPLTLKSGDVVRCCEFCYDNCEDIRREADAKRKSQEAK